MMGQALIISVGIKQVYYGLSHADITGMREEMSDGPVQKKETKYTQLSHDHAMTMLQRWQRDRQTN